MDDAGNTASAERAATAAYALFALPPLFWFGPFIALVVIRVAREPARGTWVASHLRWLRRSFWFTLLWFLVGSATAPVLVGFAVLGIGAVWYVYRIARGWLWLVDGRAMYS